MSFKNKLVNLGDAFYYKLLARELEGMESVLDLGCGSWSPLEKVEKSFYSVGVDIFKPSIEKIKMKKVHNDYRICNVLGIDKYFKKKSFDATIALDLIEHLKKEEGEELLKKMEKVSSKKIIVMTPNGYYDQKPYGDNPYQIHKSGWSIKDFTKRGYKVYGLRGFKFIRGECATIKYKPWFLWGIAAALSQYPLYYFPSLSYQLWAVKDLEDE